MASKRRRLDDEDDIALFLGVPPPAPPPDSVEETDELGRVVPSKNAIPVLRTARRLGRSNRRLLRRAQNQASREEDEGYSTDGSLSPADADDFRAAMAQLDQRREGVLSDVRADDFRNPQLGLAKWFGDWRALYEESYVGAWGGLGLVAAWEFWCRLEILGWDPIEVSSM
jgi:GC-rich sequence DNA-binding factor